MSDWIEVLGEFRAILNNLTYTFLKYLEMSALWNLHLCSLESSAAESSYQVVMQQSEQ